MNVVFEPKTFHAESAVRIVDSGQLVLAVVGIAYLVGCDSLCTRDLTGITLGDACQTIEPVVLVGRVTIDVFCLAADLFIGHGCEVIRIIIGEFRAERFRCRASLRLIDVTRSRTS